MWVGVGHVDGNSAQTGYVRHRNLGSTVPPGPIFFKIFAETLAGPHPINDYDRVYKPGPGPNTGSHIYQCTLLSAFPGTWTYRYDDDFDWHNFAHNGWATLTGTHYAWEAEISHTNNDMVGRSNPNLKCKFTVCEFELNFGGFQLATIVPLFVPAGDLYSDNKNEWMIEGGILTSSFHVWDVNPNP